MQEKYHKINNIKPGSAAEEMGIEPGDLLISINDKPIEDIFDYQYLTEDIYVEVLIRKPDGEEWLLEIDKDEEEDLGLEFENGLMDDYRSCRNKCIFCFIDQMPKGMRDTLYFKDDDSRLSFLQGNYVTLTNMSDHDIERIIEYHLSPINVSFQTMNPELRCKMLNNRFAGDALKKVDRLYEGGITMNGQIVLCKGVNDGKELEFSLEKLQKYIPVLQSVSIVPVGLTKFREGLYPLELMTKADAEAVINLVEKIQDKCFAQHGTHFVHASDEFYILAGRDMPAEERYDGYLQLENGVGMVRLLMDEYYDALDSVISDSSIGHASCEQRVVSIATGRLISGYIQKIADSLMENFPGLKVLVYPIRNDFFGENITVSGLITGQDLVKQMSEVERGDVMFIPQNMLRSGEEVFLDDYTLEKVRESLQVPIKIVKSSGREFILDVLGY